MPDDAAEPLISRHRGIPRADGGDSDGEEDTLVNESDLVAPGIFIWALTVCAGVSGLLFGYDTGVISSTLISINQDLSSRPLSTLDKSLITSSTSLFALIASPLTGLLADGLGRKPVILVADILFILGALWQALTHSVVGMIAGRSIVGAAVGGASFVVPLYISELSPSPFRGRLVTVSSLFITGGQVVAYVVGWAFSERVRGWRWMVGLGALPAAVQFGLLWGMPESPRWLVRSGKKERARVVLRRVYGGGVEIERLAGKVLRGIESEIWEEENGHVVNEGGQSNSKRRKRGLKTKLARVNDKFALLVSDAGHRRALTIACMLQAFQQLCGFNSLMYFSATIFSLLGFRSPTLTALSIALTNFAFTLVAFHAIDRIGRRRILLWSVPIMVVGLAACAVGFGFVDKDDEVNELVRDSSGAGQEPVSSWDGRAWPLVILLAMIAYVAGYAVGMGNVPWQQAELFPLPTRSLGSSLSTATNWASNTLVGLTFLPLINVLKPEGTFALYALVCVAGWVAIWNIYPERMGVGLESVGGMS